MLYLANKKSSISQGKLVSRYVSYVDPINSILRADKKGNEDSEIIAFETNATGYNASKISKIMSGENVLTFTSDLETRILNIPKSVEIFKNKASNWFSNDSKIILILSLLDLIEKNITDNNTSEAESLFWDIFKISRKDFITQDSFVFSDLMIKILLYTSSKAFSDNHKERIKQMHDDIKSCGRKVFSMKDSNCITNYINELKKRIHNNKYFWDDKKETLTVKESNSETIRSSTTIKPNNIASSSITIPDKYKQCQFCTAYKETPVRTFQTGKCMLNDINVNTSDICVHYQPNYGKITRIMLTQPL